MSKSTAAIQVIEKLIEIGANAYTPVCNFAFRCAVQSINGEIFYGVNWELQNFRIGSCAELSALSNMISHQGASLITNVWLMADQEDDEKVYSNCPCGICRQHLMEYATPETQLHLIAPSGRHVASFALATLMPRPFNYRAYLPHVQALLEKIPAKSPFPSDHTFTTTNNVRAYLEYLKRNVFCPAFYKAEACVLVLENNQMIGGVSFSTASLKSSNSAIKSALSQKITYWRNMPIKKIYTSLAEADISGEDFDIINYFNILEKETILL